MTVLRNDARVFQTPTGNLDFRANFVNRRSINHVALETPSLGIPGYSWRWKRAVFFDSPASPFGQNLIQAKAPRVAAAGIEVALRLRGGYVRLALLQGTGSRLFRFRSIYGIFVAPSSPPDNNDLRPSDASGTDTSGTEASGDANWSQLETLQALARIVREEKLGELQVRFGTARLKIKAPDARPARTASASTAPSPFDTPPFDAQNLESHDDLQSPGAHPHAVAVATGAVDANVVAVVSPMVGLFYRAPSPNDPVFVSVGDRVEIGQTLGLIETMKVFNEITSEVEGTVASIAFENGQLIETGDSIMTIRRS